MAFGKKTGGRVAGTPNKRTHELVDRLHDLGVDPVAGLAEIAKDENAPLEIRARVQMELMAYLYPKRKAVEVAGPNQPPIVINLGIEPVPAPVVLDSTV